MWKFPRIWYPTPAIKPKNEPRIKQKYSRYKKWKTELKLFIWNVRSLNEHRALQRLAEILSTYKTNINAIQEVRWLGRGIVDRRELTTIAQYVKNKNADEFLEQFPATAMSIKNNHYVEDYIESFDDEETAIRTAREITYIHKKGGFQMGKWISNSVNVLESLGGMPLTK